MAGIGTDEIFDTIVIGSGFGGAMVARELVHAGQRVLMLERGDWVQRGPQNWDAEAFGFRTPYYSTETSYDVHTDGGHTVGGAFNCVGGPSVFYGGAALRFRERDFERHPEIAGDSGARWPIGYAALEPYYTRAERLLHVAGDAGADPTEPPRSAAYPQPPSELSEPSQRVERAARSLGLRPFRLPLAISFAADDGSGAGCVRCGTCDGFACAVQAKNDLASGVLPALLDAGLLLRENTVAVRLAVADRQVSAVECVDRRTGERLRFRAERYVVAAGALATPHLLLASGLERLNPGGRVVGRYLMRHRNVIVLAAFPARRHPSVFQKQLAIHDFYFGRDGGAPRGKLGSIQQWGPPPVGVAREKLTPTLAWIAPPLFGRTTGLLTIAEDQPRAENGVTIDPARRDRFGLPQAVIHHHYTRRDVAAGRTLAREARRILRRAGAWPYFTHVIDSFSHACGTVRMGDDPTTSAVDASGHFRGVENLWIADGSVMPTSAAVNPSLTIAALALRIGELLGRASHAVPAGGRLPRHAAQAG